MPSVRAFSVVISGLLCLGPWPAASAHEEPDEEIEEITDSMAEGMHHAQHDAPEAQAKLFVRRGRLYLLERGYQAALADLDQALALDPSELTPWIYRAEALHQLGNDREALEDLDHYIAHAPPYYGAFETRAEIRSAVGDLEGAVADLSAAIKLYPTPEQCVQRARLLTRLNRTAEAIASYKDAIGRLGAAAPIVLELVELQAKAGQGEEALEWLAEMERQTPVSVQWTLRRAELLTALGRTADAQTAYAMALNKLDAGLKTGRVTDMVVLSKAQALAGLGRQDEARALLGTVGFAGRNLDEYQRLATSLGATQ